MNEDCLKWGCLGLIIVFASATRVHAEVPAWKVVTNKSAIMFTAVQNSAPVSGKFKNFYGDIHFDPAKLDESKVHIDVDMGSVSTNYPVIADTLKLSDWFDISAFPHATFTSKKITQLPSKEYEASGDLTIRDHVHPIKVKFTVEQPTKDSMVAKGTTDIQRTAFGVGQGEWASTNEIKDNVRVEVNLHLKQ